MASPWPFAGMIGMACAFFMYAATGLAAPWWVAVPMMLVWVVLCAVACAWWTPRPKGVVGLAAVTIALWFAVVLGGAFLFDWN